MNYTYMDMLRMVGGARGYDVVDVIRCKDCRFFHHRHMKYGECKNTMWTGAYAPDVTTEGFCSWAERREE